MIFQYASWFDLREHKTRWLVTSQYACFGKFSLSYLCLHSLNESVDMSGTCVQCIDLRGDEAPSTTAVPRDVEWI